MNRQAALQVLRWTAFIPMAPVYAVGYILLGCIEDDERDPWDDWPVELRCLMGYAALFMLVVLLIGLCGLSLREALQVGKRA